MKRLLFSLLITATLCGCVYHPQFEQGNILTPHNTYAITLGMTPQEVVAKLGDPLLENIYADNRVVYVYTQQPSRHKTTVKRLILTFQNGHVVDIKTDVPRNANPEQHAR